MRSAARNAIYVVYVVAFVLAPGFGLAHAAGAGNIGLVQRNPSLGVRSAPGFVPVGHRCDDDDDCFVPYPAPAYLPPPPLRDYDFAPPAPPARYDDRYYWSPPPRPASCGKYRYWNGEYCADARRSPPYVGPRW